MKNDEEYYARLLRLKILRCLHIWIRTYGHTDISTQYLPVCKTYEFLYLYIYYACIACDVGEE